jgi:hypothetical protein
VTQGTLSDTVSGADRGNEVDLRALRQVVQVGVIKHLDDGYRVSVGRQAFDDARQGGKTCKVSNK